MTEARNRVVCDAGPLIHLDELGCLSLLSDFDDVLVPGQVWREVAQYRPTALARSEVALQNVDVTISRHAPFQTLVRSFALDLGEQAALTLMQTYPQAIFLTDDAAARLAAVPFGYQAHGSIGILIRAIRRGQRTREQILTLLRALPTHSTLHIRAGLLQDIIARLEAQE